jgi:hypothetical protein
MSNRNFKYFSGLIRRREERDLINKVDFKVFFKRRDQTRISDEFNLLIAGFDESQGDDIGRIKRFNFWCYGVKNFSKPLYFLISKTAAPRAALRLFAS